MDNWREKLDPMLKEHLESLITDSARHREAYKLARNTSTAQVWCAVATLQKQVVDLSLRIKFLEKVLKEINGDKRKKRPADEVDAAKALKDVLKRL